MGLESFGTGTVSNMMNILDVKQDLQGHYVYALNAEGKIYKQYLPAVNTSIFIEVDVPGISGIAEDKRFVDVIPEGYALHSAVDKAHFTPSFEFFEKYPEFVFLFLANGEDWLIRLVGKLKNTTIWEVANEISSTSANGQGKTLPKMKLNSVTFELGPPPPAGRFSCFINSSTGVHYLQIDPDFFSVVNDHYILESSNLPNTNFISSVIEASAVKNCLLSVISYGNEYLILQDDQGTISFYRNDQLGNISSEPNIMLQGPEFDNLWLHEPLIKLCHFHNGPDMKLHFMTASALYIYDFSRVAVSVIKNERLALNYNGNPMQSMTDLAADESFAFTDGVFAFTSKMGVIDVNQALYLGKVNTSLFAFEDIEQVTRHSSLDMSKLRVKLKDGKIFFVDTSNLSQVERDSIGFEEGLIHRATNIISGPPSQKYVTLTKTQFFDSRIANEPMESNVSVPLKSYSKHLHAPFLLVIGSITLESQEQIAVRFRASQVLLFPQESETFTLYGGESLEATLAIENGNISVRLINKSSNAIQSARFEILDNFQTI
ncbi:hypothetical protein [Aureibacter tunicatorum]|uniref:Uncharacterized protein n=1 Tax=Aureibacter tunicatorum TaxID=866807 RepID=A0AAE3XRX3_9BACT|nr:hypothetical protein [Aureibacter tunicatorum]MDR6240968.1 hypothetical protein [Aureibacter tunicatorum]BDD03748.1 hypothetical protein AUTU_12310 [Aureibacter tunicatorum]